MHRANSIYRHLQLIIAATKLALLIILVPCVHADERPETRVIRADRLPAKTLSEHSVIPARDPFAWPIDQLRKFEDSDDSIKKDPFADFTLNGIVWTEGDPVAIINNKPLRRGDSIDGVKIQDIDKNSVIIANRRTSRKLRFPDPFIELNKK